MSQPFPLPSPLLDLVNKELEQGETPVWIGQPIPTFFTPCSLALFLFGLAFSSGNIIFPIVVANMMSEDASTEMFIFLAVLEIPSLIIGLALLATPILTKYRLKKTLYAVTDRRAIVFSGNLSSTSVRSFSPEELQNIQRKEKENGVGDLALDANADPARKYTVPIPTDTFFNIPNVREVEGYVKDLAIKAELSD